MTDRFSHHESLVEFFGDTLPPKGIEEIESILFAYGGSAKPFRKAIEAQEILGRIRRLANDYLRWEQRI